MPNFTMTCSCGLSSTMEAASRDEAVGKFKEMMTQEMLDQHFLERHQPSEQKPTLEQAHASLQQMVAPA